jgi:hypothetical protein
MFILYITCRYSHFNILFSSPCQRQCGLLASVVCCLSSVNFSHFNLLLWNPSAKMNWNLVESIYGRSSLKSAHFVMIHYQTWPSTCNSCFWLANFFKSPPLKPLGQINRNIAGSIYGMTSMMNAHFVSIG